MSFADNNLGTIIDRHKDSVKVAVIDRGNKYSYKQFYEDICRFSAGISLSTNFGDVVAIDMFNSYQFSVSYFGTIRAGRVALPFNFKVPDAYKEYVYSDSKAVVTITHENFDQFLGEGDGKVEVTDDTPALMLYTSGSTSHPKGVILPHSHKWFVKQKVEENKLLGVRVTLISGPCYHASSLRNTEIHFAGHSTIVYVPNFESSTVAHAIDRYKPNVIATVPTIISRIVNEPELLATCDFSSIRVIISAGAPVTETLYKQVAKHFVNAKLVNRYGITEIGPGLFHSHPDGRDSPQGSVGYPMDDIEYRIVDGVLQIKSPTMMLKYNNLPSASITEDGFYISNDLFRVDEEGFYYYIGRADDMFTNGGNNIYPRQVELVIESHPMVREAAVVGIEDEIKGAKPYALVTLNGPVTGQAIKDLVLSQLPASHCPKEVWVIENLPLNTVNKIDRKELKAQAELMLKNGVPSI